MKSLWEILVPTIFNSGKPIRTRYHRVWDAKVRTISGGMTILTPAKGHWISPTGKLFTERMIPVRILATDEEMDSIITMTMKYYDQEAILAYEISSKVKLVHRNEGS